MAAKHVFHLSLFIMSSLVVNVDRISSSINEAFLTYIDRSLKLLEETVEVLEKEYKERSRLEMILFEMNLIE